jgi:hypothetical protein
VLLFCVCAPNEKDGVVCAPFVGVALCWPNPPKGLLFCCPKPLETGCCGWLWPKVKEAAGAGVEDCSILSGCCWPKAKPSDAPKPGFGCCCACCAPKLKLLGVAVNVFGVKVLGPVMGDAERALPPRLMLAILFALLAGLPNGVLR